MTGRGIGEGAVVPPGELFLVMMLMVKRGVRERKYKGAVPIYYYYFFIVLILTFPCFSVLFLFINSKRHCFLLFFF